MINFYKNNKQSNHKLHGATWVVLPVFNGLTTTFILFDIDFLPFKQLQFISVHNENPLRVAAIWLLWLWFVNVVVAPLLSLITVWPKKETFLKSIMKKSLSVSTFIYSLVQRFSAGDCHFSDDRESLNVSVGAFTCILKLYSDKGNTYDFEDACVFSRAVSINGLIASD